MIETIGSVWDAATVYFSMGLFFVLGSLFVISCLCIAVWMYNWPIFVFAGTAWGGLALALGYAWLCVAYYKPFIEWMPRHNNSRVQVEEVQFLSGPAAAAPTVKHGGQSKNLPVVGEWQSNLLRNEPITETREDRLDVLMEQLQRRELQTE